MKKITEDMLNDYLDNNLDTSSIEELKSALTEDEKLLNKLKALKAVDHSLRNIEVYEAPAHFTERVMKLIVERTKALKPKINYFFLSIMSFFSLGIVAVFISALLFQQNDKASGQEPQLFKSVKEFISNNFASFEGFFNNNNILLVGGLLTLILFLSAFFVLDSHKNFKNKLKHISH